MMTLAEYMRQEGLSQRKLADILGLSRSYTNELVRGEKTPSLATALLIQSTTAGRVSLSSLVQSPSDAPAQEAEQ